MPSKERTKRVLLVLLYVIASWDNAVFSAVDRNAMFNIVARVGKRARGSGMEPMFGLTIPEEVVKGKALHSTGTRRPFLR
jgi:hypothetical protein